jgi:predicted amidohydrolase
MTSKVAAIQMVSCSAVGPNLMTMQMLVNQAVEQGAQLIVLPENFAFMGNKDQDKLLIQEKIGSGRIQDFVAKCAQAHGVWIVAGTIPVTTDDPNKVASACLVFDGNGKQVARYDKIHLFDVFLGATGETYQESAHIKPGDEVVVVDSPFGKIGLSVCYDVRFPELYRQLREKGADILVVPSAFTATTGRMHWRTLLRTRAIENQCYLIAANQGGVHDNGRETHGHSMVIGPWGIVMGCKEVGIGTVVAEIDLVRIQVLREEFPVWDHRRL